MLKRIFEFLISNRFTRLLALIIQFFVVFAIMLFIGLSIDDSSLIFAPTLIFAICFVGQLFGDIMNVEGWFNNTFVTLLKRIIFFVVVLATCIFGVAYVIGDDVWGNMVVKDASIFEKAINLATNFACPLAFFAYVMAYVMHAKEYHHIDNKKWLPCLYITIYLASIVLGFIVSLIFNIVNIPYNVAPVVLGLIDVAIVVVAIIISLKSEVWVFEESSKVYYNSSSSLGSYTPKKSEYDKFREKCCNCVHQRSCRLDTNDGWGTKRNADYCNLTGKEVDIYSYCCSRFEDRHR